MDLIYVFINSGPLMDFCFFSDDFLDELATIKGLVMLCGVHMRAPWSSTAFCSDACLTGFAIAQARLHPQEVAAAGRFRERWRFKLEEPARPEHVGYGPPDGSLAIFSAAAGEARLGPLGPSQPHSQRVNPRPLRKLVDKKDSKFLPLPDDVLQASRWHLIIRGGFLFQEAIHMLEARIVFLGLKRATRSSHCHGHRILSISDNLSELLAFERGRATNWALRQLTRVAAARQIGCEIDHHHRYVESARNTTDYDSRATERGEVRAGEIQRGAAAALRHQGPPLARPGSSSTSRPSSSTSLSFALTSSRATSLPRLPLPPALPPPAVLTAAEPPPAPPWEPGKLLPTAAKSGGAGPRQLATPARARGRPRFFIEIYAGCARLIGACLDQSLACGVAIELEDGKGKWHDLHDPRIFTVVRRWIVQRQAWCCHFGTPCTHWSTATPADAKEKHASSGRTAAARTFTLLKLCTRYNIRWSLENPQSSRLWSWPPPAAFLAKVGATRVLVHYCQYHCRYLKPTVIMTDMARLASLGALCPGHHQHEILQGPVSVKTGSGAVRSVWKTKLAGRYPPELCRQWAAILREVAPRSALLHADSDRSPVGESELARAFGLELPQPTRRPCCPKGNPQEWRVEDSGWGSKPYSPGFRPPDRGRRQPRPGAPSQDAEADHREAPRPARQGQPPRLPVPVQKARHKAHRPDLQEGVLRAPALRREECPRDE